MINSFYRRVNWRTWGRNAVRLLLDTVVPPHPQFQLSVVQKPMTLPPTVVGGSQQPHAGHRAPIIPRAPAHHVGFLPSHSVVGEVSTAQ